MAKKRVKIIQELIDTEATYQRHLELTVKVGIFIVQHCTMYSADVILYITGFENLSTHVQCTWVDRFSKPVIYNT